MWPQAPFAALDVPTESRRPALLDGRHDLELAEAHMTALAWRHAAPWRRKMSATSSDGRPIRPPG